MYIGKLGDGSSIDDGIYILLKEIIDNSIDEFIMGYGKQIDVTIKSGKVTVRDYGRGIPLGKVIDCVSKINTGGKYDSKVFKKSIGLNGVGTKAVNALSSFFKVQSIRDGKIKSVEFKKGQLIMDEKIQKSTLRKGTKISFVPDETIFENFRFFNDYIKKMMMHYTYLNNGLTMNYNGEKFFSKNGLLDLLSDQINGNQVYPIIHLKGTDIEIAMTHLKDQYGESYSSFVNGQNTSMGGTHQSSFREAIVKTIREFYSKNFEASDIRQSVKAAISIKILEPIFESQTKTKLGSSDMGPNLSLIHI